MPVYIRYNGWYVYFWTNENDEPIHFHIAEGHPSENATKIWILKNDSFRMANNNSQVLPAGFVISLPPPIIRAGVVFQKPLMVKN